MSEEKKIIRKLLMERKGTPFLFEEALRLREEFNKILSHAWSEIDRLSEAFSELSPVYTTRDVVQRSIEALELGVGDLVRVVGSFNITSEKIRENLGEEKARLFLSSFHEGDPPPEISFRGCQGYIVDGDPSHGLLLLRLDADISVLFWVPEDVVEKVPDGDIQGLIT